MDWQHPTFEPTTSLFLNKHSIIYSSWGNDWWCVMSTYLYVTFEFMFLSRCVSVSGWYPIVAWMSRYSLLEISVISCISDSNGIKKHSSKEFEFFDIQTTCSVDSLWYARYKITTYSQSQCTDKYSQHSSIIWPVWLKNIVFVCKLSGCGIESCCCHWSFRHHTYR